MQNKSSPTGTEPAVNPQLLLWTNDMGQTAFGYSKQKPLGKFFDSKDSQPAHAFVNAVNVHTELVAALNAALLLADDEGDLPDNGEHCGAIIADQIRAALERAK